MYIPRMAVLKEAFLGSLTPGDARREKNAASATHLVRLNDCHDLILRHHATDRLDQLDKASLGDAVPHARDLRNEVL